MKRLFLLFIALTFCLFANAQVRGTVMDGDSNTPFSGAFVLKKNSSVSTVTGANGTFSINASVGDTLVFSFIGYNSLIYAIENNRTEITVTLYSSTNILDEVVVVGYGVQRRSDVTGAVASLNSQTLEERPSVNIIQALQSAIPGLNITMEGSNAEGSNSVTTIRGGNSITASNAPLVILDGIPFSGAWSEINPNDVESIEVLKDASSSAIYGARGANGVILIQTKRGRAGDRLSVSYDGSIAFNNAINIPKLMDGPTFYMRKLEAGYNLSYTEIMMHERGEWTNWLDIALRQGWRQQHNLSFRGSTQSTRYYVSGNFSNSEGISLNDKFMRINLRLNLEQDLTKWLTFGTSTSYGNFDRSGNEANFSAAYTMNPLGQAYDDEGNLRLSTWEDNNYSRNPLSSLREKNRDITDRFSSNNYLNVNLPIKGLTFKLNTGYTFETRINQNYQGRDTYEGQNRNGVLAISNRQNREWLIENILSYNYTFDKHTIFLTALYSAQNNRIETNQIDARDFPNDVMSYYQPQKGGFLQANAGQTIRSYVSQMFRANYSYDSRYLFTGTVRRDGYSAFGEDRKQGVFPSLAIGWNVMNEPFFKESSLNTVVNNFKFRASWGKNGNEAISAYATLPNLRTMDFLTDDHIPAFGFYPSKLSSPALGWETTASTNFGLDLGFLKNRIRASFDYYFTQTTDLLLNRTIPAINGTSLILENIGKTKGQGFELQISSTNISKRNFGWSTDLNITRNKTVLVDVGLYDPDGKPIDDIASGWYIGYPVSVNYDYLFDGILQVGETPAYSTYNSQPGYIKYKDINGDSRITPVDDQEVIGSRYPAFSFGLNNSFRYRNLVLTIFINGAVGQTMQNNLMSTHSVSYRENQFDKDFWREDNPINTYPANVGDASVNPARVGFYEKTDFLRIKDISLAYRFPERWTGLVKISRFEVYGNIRNLYTFTSWGGLDPEFARTGSRQRSIPQTREFLIGARVSF